MKIYNYTGNINGAFATYGVGNYSTRGYIPISNSIVDRTSIVFNGDTYSYGFSGGFARMYRNGTLVYSSSSSSAINTVPIEKWFIGLTIASNNHIRITIFCETEDNNRLVIYGGGTLNTSKNTFLFYRNAIQGYINSDSPDLFLGLNYDTGILFSGERFAIEPQWFVNYTTFQNGTISGVSTAFSGETVTLTVTPDSGYVLSSLAVYKTSSQDPVDYTKVNDTTYTFVMPDTNVTVTGIFVRAYTITLACSPSSAGTVTRSPSDELVTPGTNVSFTVTPNSGFIVSTMDFSTGVSVSYNQSTNVGTFEMPERLVYGTIYLALEGDPNAQGGTSQPGTGGGGDFSSTDDIVPLPSQPEGVLNPPVVPTTALGKGIIAVYNPTMSELADLGQWLYGTDWADVLFNGIRDLFLKPLDSIISLHILPVKPSTMEYKGTCFLGPHNTMIDMERVSNQYVDKYCGSLKIEPYWGSYLDYNPYTKISLFLPYIGSVDLNPDIVMDKTIGIRYRIDVVTGACVAYIYNYETVEGQGLVESVFAEYSGSMALTLPLSGSDFSQLISGFVSAVSSVMVLKSFGASAMISKASEDVSIANAEFVGAKEQLANAQTGFKNLRGANGQWVSYKTQRDEAIAAATDRLEEAKTGLAMARGAEKAVKSMQQATRFATVPYTVGQVMGSKVQTAISGTITGGMGLLGSQTPYLIITRPRQSLPENYKHYAGYPANFYAKLSTLTGYTKVEQCELTNIPCTDTELAMLYAALKEGVYI